MTESQIELRQKLNEIAADWADPSFFENVVDVLEDMGIEIAADTDDAQITRALRDMITHLSRAKSSAVLFRELTWKGATK